MRFCNRLTACLLAAGLLFTNPGSALLPDLALTAYAEKSVRATHSVNLKEGETLYVDITGSPGDEIQVHFFYLDSDGNNASSIVGALGGTVLDEDGKTTVPFVAPNALNSIDIKVVYQTYPLSVSLRKEAAESVFSGTCGENLTWTFDKNGTLTISGSGKMDNWDYENSNENTNIAPWNAYKDQIQSVIIKDGVTTIGENAFTWTALQRVTLPEGLARIEDSAFSFCYALKEINLPDSLTYIGEHAFSETVITEISIPENVSVLKNGVFLRCNALTSVIIGSGVKEIEANVFMYCTSLKEITIPKNVSTIGAAALSIDPATDKSENEHLKKVTIMNPDCILFGLDGEETDAFDGSATICDTAVIYSYTGSTAEAYANKYNRTFEALDSPDSFQPHDVTDQCTDIDRTQNNIIAAGRYECHAGDTIWFPVYLYNNTGYTTTGLRLIYHAELKPMLSDNGKPVTKKGRAIDDLQSSFSHNIEKHIIGLGTGSNNSIIETDSGVLFYVQLKIPDNAESGTLFQIRVEPDKWMSNAAPVSYMTYDGWIHIYDGSECIASGSCGEKLTWKLDNAGTLTISGTGKMDDWGIDVDGKVTTPWNSYSNDIKTVLIEKGATNIEDVAFFNCTNLTSIKIPDSVTSIGVQAFYNCTSLKDITIPDSVTSIGGQTFEYCTSLTDIIIPASVTIIGNWAFNKCKNLSGITIENPNCKIEGFSETICNAYNNNECSFTGTIYGYTGSTAEAYANKYNRIFVPLDAQETTTATTTTTTTTTTVTTDTAPTEQTTTTTTAVTGTPFRRGIDDWGFINSRKTLGVYNQEQNIYQYRIDDADKDALLAKLSNSEAALIRAELEKKNSGACFGMSVTSLLQYYGLFRPSDLVPEADYLAEITEKNLTARACSAINYYQMLQFTKPFSQLIRKTEQMSDPEKLKQLIDLMDSGKPCVLGYVYDGPSGERFAHAVVAYGIRRLPSVLPLTDTDRFRYDTEILIYDNMSKSDSIAHNMLINTKDWFWCIPTADDPNEYGKLAIMNRSSYRSGMINFICADAEMLNSYGMFTGSNSVPEFDYTRACMTVTQFKSIAHFGSIHPQKDGTFYGEGDEGDIELTASFFADDAPPEIKAVMNSDLGYFVAPESPDAMHVTMEYEICLLHADADEASKVSVAPDGSIECEKSKGSYLLSMVLDEGHHATDWHTLRVSGKDGGTVRLKSAPEMKGWILQGDSLQDVTVKANGSKSSAVASFSTNFEKALIYQIDENTISIAVDSDKNGSYETKLDTATTTTTPITTVTTTTTITTIVTSTTTMVTTTTMTTTTAAEQQPFRCGGFNEWGFKNNRDLLGKKEKFNNKSYYTYNLKDSDLNTILTMLSDTEREQIEKRLNNPEKPVGGFYYGMSVTAILGYYGAFNFSDLVSGADYSYDITAENINDNVRSAISCYQLLQYSKAIEQITRKTVKLGEQKKFEPLLIALEAGKPVVLGYTFEDERGGKNGHAVVAYGIQSEVNSIQIDSKMFRYNKHILIYDNLKGGHQDEYDLYLDTDSWRWCIPRTDDPKSKEGAAQVIMNQSAYKNGCISLVLTDSEIMNYCGLFGGKSLPVHMSDAEYQNACAQYEPLNGLFAMGDYGITEKAADGSMNAADDDGKISFSADFFEDTAEEGINPIKASFDDVYGFYLAPKSGGAQTMTVSMEYEHYLMDVRADSAERVEFTPDAEIECTKTSGAYTLEMVADKEVRAIDWHKITVTGKDGGTLRMQFIPDGSGLILEADSLKNVSIKAKSHTSEANRSFSTEYGTVKIYEIDENTIGLAVDTNGDAIYETVLEADNLTGDVNSDSGISVEDAQLALTAYVMVMAGMDSGLTDQQLKAADINEDGDVSVEDAQLILLYYVSNTLSHQTVTWDELLGKDKPPVTTTATTASIS